MVTVASVRRALCRVHGELDGVGLLRDRLEAIEVVVCAWPAGLWGVAGFVFDRGVSGSAALVGFKPGVIYIPRNAPLSRRRGHTIADLLRHELAHALAWLEPALVGGAWFRKTFGGAYDDAWDVPPEFDADEYVSDYATNAPCEDFAESFMLWLRLSSSRRRGRLGCGVQRKIAAIESRCRATSRRAA